MDQGTTYEEHKQQLRAAYQAAMSAKRHLASLDTESYLVESIRFLAEDPSSGEGWYERLPWAIFLSMKWAIRSAGLTGVRRKATREDVATVKRLLNCAGPLLRVYRPDSTGTPRVKPFLLLRRMALQQFWYQTKFDEACLGRQASLFMGGRPELYSWEVAFESAYQVTIGEFLKHTAAMVEALSYLIGEESLQALPDDVLHGSDESTLKWISERFAVDFEYLCAEEAQREDSLRRPQRHASSVVPQGIQSKPYRASLSHEVCEQTTLYEVPFIRLGGVAEMVHPRLFYHCVETALYDRLRRLGSAQTFGKDFGRSFENYVHEVLSELTISIRETELRSILLVDREADRAMVSCVDFLVDTPEATILIEAKGGKPHHRGMFGVDPKSASKDLKEGELDAVRQAVETWKSLPAALRRPKAYLICVTSFQAWIGRGTVLRDMADGDSVWAAVDGLNVLSPIDQFFAPISEFERVISLCKSQGRSLADVCGGLSAKGVDAGVFEMSMYFRGVTLTSKPWPDAIWKGFELLAKVQG